MVSLEIRGKIVGPTFEFDKEEISFGPRSIGFESTEKIMMFNSSMISVPIELGFQHENESDGNIVAHLKIARYKALK